MVEWRNEDLVVYVGFYGFDFKELFGKYEIYIKFWGS